MIIIKRIWKKADINELNPIKAILKLNKVPEKDWDLFLHGTIKDLPRINKAYKVSDFIKRVNKAIEGKEKICLYSDYDVDGMTGGSVAYLMIKELGGNPYIWTNNKQTDGYGINLGAVKKLANHPNFPGTSLIITIDNGINAIEGVRAANELGVEVIVTDHHERAKEEVAPITVDLKQGNDDYEFRELCGCGLIWKLLRELYIERGREEETHKYLDLVALGTVADLVPLLGENRIIVKEGLRVMNTCNRAIFRAFKEFLAIGSFNEELIGFQIAPCLNAKTRINGEADNCLEALTSNDYNKVSNLVLDLINTNRERKNLTKREEVMAKDLVEKNEIYKNNLLFVINNDFHGGIVGLTAGRLAKAYARPAIVGEIMENNIVRCSTRSYGDFNIFELLDSHKDKLLSYGGHKMAAGLSFDLDDFNSLKEELLNDQRVKDIKPLKEVSYLRTLKPSDISLEFVQGINSLAPFGQDFRKPLFRIFNLQVAKHEISLMGSGNEHIKIRRPELDIVGWNLKNRLEQISEPFGETSYDLIVDLSINEFKGKEKPQAMIYEDNIASDMCRIKK